MVPFNSTTKLGLPLLQFTLPLLRIPGPAWPGATEPPEAVELIAPTVPVPPNVPPFTLAALEACEPFTISVAALVVVVPEYVLAPDKISVPVPVFVRATAPLPFWMMPENVVELLLPPAVRMTAPAALLVTVPAPASEPMTSLKPPRSNVAPAATVTALAEPIALVMPSRSVPALIAVAPV